MTCLCFLFNRTVILGNIIIIQIYMLHMQELSEFTAPVVLNCCSRWYFTFNGNECSGPMTIEGIVYGDPANDNPHRHRQIEGYCENIAAGQVTIGFNIGKCWKGGVSDGNTGWSSISRIMISEVPPSQK